MPWWSIQLWKVLCAQGGVCASLQHGSLLLKADPGVECPDYSSFQSNFLLLIFYVVPMSLAGEGGVRHAYWKAGASAAWQLDDLSVRRTGCSSKRLGRSHLPPEQGKIQWYKVLLGCKWTLKPDVVYCEGCFSSLFCSFCSAGDWADDQPCTKDVCLICFKHDLLSQLLNLADFLSSI